jgi:hypothetical protein
VYLDKAIMAVDTFIHITMVLAVAVLEQLGKTQMLEPGGLTQGAMAGLV